MKPRLNQIRRLDSRDYAFTWEDGFTLTVSEEFGLEIIDDLDLAHRLRAKSAEKLMTEDEVRRIVRDELKQAAKRIVVEVPAQRARLLTGVKKP